MTWKDFLKYSKFIAVFYATAFVIGILGIWLQPHSQWIWTAILFFAAALAANVALGFYQANHKGQMLLAKNEYMATQDRPQVVTSESKAIDTVSGMPNEIDMLLDEVATRAARRARGY